jgi:hypothetical protein
VKNAAATGGQSKKGEIEGEGIFPIQVHSGAYYFYYDNMLFVFLMSHPAIAFVVPTIY